MYMYVIVNIHHRPYGHLCLLILAKKNYLYMPLHTSVKLKITFMLLDTGSFGRFLLTTSPVTRLVLNLLL